MTPPMKPPGSENKSWRKINDERKALKRERRQERLIREVENAEKLKELAKAKKAEEANKKPDPSTVSIAVPGSILENAQSPELRSYLAGQIARAACIFRVNEVIVFDDIGIATARDTKVVFDDETNGAEGEETVTRTVRASSLQLARILQYLECPQYLRKFFFPLHKDLKYSGIMNPLETPHHLRQQTVFLYREGVVTEKPAKEGRCFVNVGLLNDVLVNKAIKPGVRVTVKMDNVKESKKLRGIVVSPDEPRRETGVYWGYTVRIAHSLAEIFTKSPYKGGYDRTIGTSDRGSNIQEVEKSACAYNHLLIVFGGLAGLETALSNDEKLNVEDPALLFDHYLNVLPNQGSRTIRTEEAVLIAMSALQEKLNPQVADIEDTEFKELLPRSEDTGIKPVYETATQKDLNVNSSRNPFTNSFKQRRREHDHDQQQNEETTENDTEIVHSNPFVNGIGNDRRNKNIIENEAADDEGTQAVNHHEKKRSFKQRNNAFERRTKNMPAREPADNETTTQVENQEKRNFKQRNNPFERRTKNMPAREPADNETTTQVDNQEKRNIKQRNNTFERNERKVDKKRKFQEHHNGDKGEFDKKSFKKSTQNFEPVPTKPNVASVENDDLEVVPSSGNHTPAKHKKFKKDLDLSRFD